MRTHSQIIADAGGSSTIKHDLGLDASIHAIRSWVARDSIPSPYWQVFAKRGLATLDELARAVAKCDVEVSHSATLPDGSGVGAENPNRNVSRTNEPGSSVAEVAA